MMIQNMRKLWSIVVFYLLFAVTVQAQERQGPENWFNLDESTDSILGIGTERAYAELLKGREADPVTVAVIDGGVEVDHEDLKNVIWVNPRETPGNGKDDDKNGYIDDIYGWNFIGGKDGKQVQYDNLEITRLYRKLKPKYEFADTSRMSPGERAEYRRFLNMKETIDKKLAEARQGYENYSAFYDVLQSFAEKLDKQDPDREDIQRFKPTNEYEETVKKVVLENLSDTTTSFRDFIDHVKEGVEYFGPKVKYQYNVDYDPRPIVGDNYNNSGERDYGNNKVEGPDAMHGTHVAGIIGASRDNDIGIRGVAGPVRLMAVRTVPDGDERDKDVANSIRYAAENGAKVINMSFGKGYSWDKKVVDDAVKYALSKDVLFVHAAGNDAKDVDKETNYPSPYFSDSTRTKAWIEVGATTWKGGDELIADFSNYGKERVDLFAPGYEIYSTTPGSAYKNLSGTSMAAPVVSGVAALIRAYYPELSATEVKEVIMESVTPINWEVIKPGNGARVKMTELCISGGVINAYQALLVAEQKMTEKSRQGRTAQAREAAKPQKERGWFQRLFGNLFGKKQTKE